MYYLFVNGRSDTCCTEKERLQDMIPTDAKDTYVVKEYARWVSPTDLYLDSDGNVQEREIPINLDSLKTQKLTQAKTLFAEKRDAIRFITLGDVTYGFDCASEDITNFMAAWKDAEMNGSTQYKVWTSETDKGVVTLTNDNFNTVFKAVRNSQFEAYAWLTTVQAQIEACTTAEEVEAIEI